MKPAPFDYEAPRSLDAALALVGDDSRPLAGGQSLVPMLNFRIAQPARLVDLNGICELDYVRCDDEGALRIGALTRQAAIERSDVVARAWPLLVEAVRLIGHPAIRSRGTVGGSIAHADPAAELPVAVLALDARFHVCSVRGARSLPAGEFFVGPLTTALEPDELLVDVEVPTVSAQAHAAFVEQARTHGDFAIAGAAAVLSPGAAAIALLGAQPTPVRAPAAEQALVAGAPPVDVARIAAGDIGDGYRRALLAELVRRAIVAAAG